MRRRGTTTGHPALLASTNSQIPNTSMTPNTTGATLDIYPKLRCIGRGPLPASTPALAGEERERALTDRIWRTLEEREREGKTVRGRVERD
jgi:hypothetical protein